jgi:hypothetical protein
MMYDVSIEVNDRHFAVAHALAVDRLAAEVTTAWRAHGIEPILLKGASLATWLYADDVRPYGDADLLVDPERVWDAAAVLEQLGFAPVPHHVSLHAHPWIRPDGATVDLHVRLYGVHASPSEVWLELQSSTETISLTSTAVRCLKLPARALHVAVHAAQHDDEQKPREDLRRALALTPMPVWREAERLADRIHGLPTMAMGLSLEPAGPALIERLPLVRAALLAETGSAPLAIGVARFAAAGSAADKLRVVRTALWPPAVQLVREGDSQGPGASLPRLRLRHLRTQLMHLPRTLRALRRAETSRSDS